MHPATPHSTSPTQRPSVPPQRGEPSVDRERIPQHAARPSARDSRGRFLPRHALDEPAGPERTDPGARPPAGVLTESDQWEDVVGNDEPAAPASRPFTYAGLRWKPDEDRVDGAWIGYRLATELYYRTTQ